MQNTLNYFIALQHFTVSPYQEYDYVQVSCPTLYGEAFSLRSPITLAEVQCFFWTVALYCS